MKDILKNNQLHSHYHWARKQKVKKAKVFMHDHLRVSSVINEIQFDLQGFLRKRNPHIQRVTLLIRQSNLATKSNNRADGHVHEVVHFSIAGVDDHSRLWSLRLHHGHSLVVFL